MQDIEIPKEPKKVKVKAFISFEMELTVKEKNAEHAENCLKISCDICESDSESVETIKEAKDYVSNSLFEMVEDAVLGRSDFDGLVNFEVKEVEK